MSAKNKITALLMALLLAVPAAPAGAQDPGIEGELTAEEREAFLGEPLEGEEHDEAPIVVTDYESCMDKAEEMLRDCNGGGGGIVMDALCVSRYGYQKLWCTIRYFQDIVF